MWSRSFDPRPAQVRRYFCLPVTRIIIVEISDIFALDAVSVVVIRVRIRIHMAVLGLVVPETVIAAELAAVLLTEVVPHTDRISNSQLLLMKSEQMETDPIILERMIGPETEWDDFVYFTDKSALRIH